MSGANDIELGASPRVCVGTHLLGIPGVVAYACGSICRSLCKVPVVKFYPKLECTEKI